MLKLMYLFRSRGFALTLVFTMLFQLSPMQQTAKSATQAPIITTVAEVGDYLSSPSGLALNSEGELFFADNASNCIRKVDINGTITTVAGISNPWGGGFSGDNGPATSALLNGPHGIAANNSGELFIADTFNHCIRKVDLNGTISTVAGVPGEGDMFDGDNGPATSAHLFLPRAVAVDNSDQLFIADTNNNCIRKVDENGIITTVAGIGVPGGGSLSGDNGPATSATLNSPVGIAFNSSNELFIADSQNHRIRNVDASGTIMTVAGMSGPGEGGSYGGDNGPATSAYLSNPEGLTISNSGELLIADQANQRIRKVDLGGIITTIVGSGDQGYNGDGILATLAFLNGPNAVAVSNSEVIYIADAGNYSVRKVELQDVSSDAALSGLGLSTGTLKPVFNPGTTDYTIDVAENVWYMTMTPIANESHARITFNGEEVASGGEIGLWPNLGDNPIEIIVTAQDGTTTVTYRINIRRTDTSLRDLTVNSGTLPNFDPSNTYYRMDMAASEKSIIVSAIPNSSDCTVKINGMDSPTVVPIKTGPNIINIIVTAANGATKTYTLIVNEFLANGLSTDATLSSLTTSTGNLTPAFNPGVTNYSVQVDKSVDRILISATTGDSLATYKISTGKRTVMNQSASIPLMYGPNNVKVMVAAASGKNNTYMITINRAR